MYCFASGDLAFAGGICYAKGAMKNEAAAPIKLAILEDHQGIIDGYQYRLGGSAQVEIVGAVHFGSELEPLLESRPVDVLFLDVQVPTAPDNANPYPILHVISKLLQVYPRLHILAISMMTERSLIQAVIDAGASGYILKDDREAIEQLAAIVQSIATGGIYLSQLAAQQLRKTKTEGTEPMLTARQLEVLSLCAAYPDWSRAQLASHLSVRQSTVRNLLSNAYLRLEVRTLAAALAKARQLGLLTPLPIRAP
jgi:DNA-binding NarL/FixJ family response regulator